MSLYNETNGKAIPPTPTVGAVGLLADSTRRAGFGGLKAGQVLALLGETRGALGATLYLRDVLGREDGAPPPVDLKAERAAAGVVRGLIASGQLKVVHDLSDGGLVVAAAEMALASGVGIGLSNPTAIADHAFYFGEDQARYLLALDPAQLDALDEACATAGVPYEVIGEAGGCELALRGPAGEIVAIDLDDLRATHEGWMPAFMNAPV